MFFLLLTTQLRQRGLKWRPGNNVKVGKDHTLHAMKEGIVVFKKDVTRYKYKLIVHVIPKEVPNRIVSALYSLD